MDYNAFVSYSHGADAERAPALQSGLERLAKPWWRRRALHVFCDTTALSANPALWATITDAMAESEYLVVLASEGGAQSPWVGREVEHWRSTKPTGTILPVLTSGELVWDDELGDFDPARSTALHPSLIGAFTEEPLYVDMRFPTGAALTLDNPLFLAAVAELAAPMHGVPKDELVGEDLRQHRRTRRITWAAALSLAVLAVATLVAAGFAISKADESRRRADEVLASHRSARAAKHAQHLSEAAAGAAKQGARSAERRRLHAVADAEGQRQAATFQANIAAQKQEEAIIAATKARRQQALAAAAGRQRDVANAGRDQANAEKAQANKEKGDAVAAADDANKNAADATDTANKAIDDANSANGRAAAADASTKRTTLAGLALQQERLDSALDEALLLANESSYVEPDAVRPIPHVIPPTVGAAGETSASCPSVGTNATLLTTTQIAAGLTGQLRFSGLSPPNLAHVAATASHGGRVAAAETSNLILAGEQHSRLYVWRDSSNPVDRAVELSSLLPRGDSLGCINQLDWDASGRYLFSVEDPSGCLNPTASEVSGYVERTVRLWDLDAPPGSADATVALPRALSLQAYSPLTVSSSRRVALIQFGGGVLQVDLGSSISTTQLAGFFLASTLYGGANVSQQETYALGALIDVTGSTLLPTLIRLDGTRPPVVLSDSGETISIHTDPAEQVVAAINGTDIAFFDPETGVERTELHRTFGVPVESLAVGADLAYVTLCLAADCTSGDAVIAFDWHGSSDIAWSTSVDRPVLGVLALSPGGRYVTVDWYQPHADDDQLTRNTLVLDAGTGGVRQDVPGSIAMFSAPQERFVVGQKIDVQLSHTANPVTVKASVWDLGPSDATTGAGDVVLLQKNVEVAAAPDRRSVAVFPTSLPVSDVSGLDEPVSLWTLDEGNFGVRVRELPGAKGTLHGVAFDGSGRLVAVGETPAGLVWDVADNPYDTLDIQAANPLLRTATNPDADLRAISRDGKTLVLRHLDRSGHASTETPVPDLELRMNETIDWLQFSRDGSLLFVNLHDETKESATQVHYPVGSIAIRLAPGGRSPTVVRRFAEEAIGSSGDAAHLLFRSMSASNPLNTNGTIVRAASDLHQEWRVEVDALGEDRVASASNLYTLDRTGKMLAGTNASAKVVVWSRGDGSHRTFDPGTEQAARVPLFGVAFSPDGTRLVATTPDKRIRSYDLTVTRDSPATEHRLPAAAASRVKFSDDGSLLLVDGVYLLDPQSLRQIGPRLHPPSWNDRGTDLGTSQTFFTRDNQYVVAERGDSTESVRWEVGLRVLRARACELAGRNLTQAEVNDWGLPQAALNRCRIPTS